VINKMVAGDFIESANLAEVRTTAVVLHLCELNEELLQIQAKIKASQPVADGAVCLELYRCGPFCTGCPHPRWVKYRWTTRTAVKPASMFCINLSAKGINPAQAVAKSSAARPHLLPLIREAKGLLAERAALLKALRALSPFARPRH
jgi:hypothetical protein